jgi:hypothetical protein
VKIRYHKVALSSSVAKTGYLYSTLGSNVQHAHDLNLSLLFFLLTPTTFGGALWPARRRSSPTPPSPSTRPAVELAGGFPQDHQPPPCPATNTSSPVARLSNPPYNSPPPHNGAQPPSPFLQSSSTSSWRCREAPTGAWGVTARWAAARGWQRNRRAAAPRGGQLILTEVYATERASAGLCFVSVW